MSASSTAPDARTRLARAAVDAFAARGFHGTTTRDISTAAGMSPAALYVHHRSKEELLFELSLVGHERVLELVRASVAVSDDPVEQLATFVEDFVRDHAVAHTGARVINYELAALSARAPRRDRRRSATRSTGRSATSSSAASTPGCSPPPTPR